MVGFPDVSGLGEDCLLNTSDHASSTVLISCQCGMFRYVIGWVLCSVRSIHGSLHCLPHNQFMHRNVYRRIYISRILFLKLRKCSWGIQFPVVQTPVFFAAFLLLSVFVFVLSLALRQIDCPFWPTWNMGAQFFSIFILFLQQYVLYILGCRKEQHIHRSHRFAKSNELSSKIGGQAPH